MGEQGTSEHPVDPVGDDSDGEVRHTHHDRHHYGGEHHRMSIIDRLGERVEHALDAADEADPLMGRDPDFLRRTLPLLDGYLRYFDAAVEGFDHLPASGPVLVVGNHSGGIWMPDFWAFQREVYRRRGTDWPLYSLGFDFLYAIPGTDALARKIGSVPASHGHAGELLDAGATVVVYPGGDEDDYRPWTERHRIDLEGRTGFVRLALRHRVPVVPLVAHGSHDVLIVLTRGERLARTLGFDRLRINIMPIVAGPPWGIAPVQLPTWPFPAKVTARVCEPLDWTHLPPEAADDPDTVRRCYEEILGRMQANLDELVAATPHPVFTRVTTAAGLDRLGRLLGRR